MEKEDRRSLQQPVQCFVYFVLAGTIVAVLCCGALTVRLYNDVQELRPQVVSLSSSVRLLREEIASYVTERSAVDPSHGDLRVPQTPSNDHDDTDPLKPLYRVVREANSSNGQTTFSGLVHYLLDAMQSHCQPREKLCFTGPKGDIGMPGLSGSPGESGRSGTPGMPGTAGAAGLPGLPGAKGIKGNIGLEGSKGPAGKQGPKGLKSTKGEIGDRGFKGDIGIGEKGTRGVQGVQGIKGDKGEVGYKGDRGYTGFNGTQGVQGIKGDKGEVGYKGDRGYTGFNGTQGVQGVQGLKGGRGVAGFKGDVGLPGSKGEKGQKGGKGYKGSQGELGEAGAKGEKGQKGEEGEIVSPRFKNHLVRLAGGTSRYGRVEIRYNGNWGTICDDAWDLNDAKVVCRQLGYSTATEAPGSAKYGQGSGSILMDDVECGGNEMYLEDCSFRGWGKNNCSHDEDASVVCQ